MKPVLIALLATCLTGAVCQAEDANPAAIQQAAKPAWNVRPFLSVVGGLQHEAIWNRAGTQGDDPLTDGRGDRFVTLALSRFGLRGNLGDTLELHSELEVNGGPYGSSVWEGQAAMQVNNQLLRLSRWGMWLDAGRITDPSSVDFTSAHVADQLLMDTFTRIPMLESGFNRGNGLLLGYQIIPGLKAAVTFNSANPLSTTGSYLISGKYTNGLYTRWYRTAGQQILKSPSRYPLDGTHLTVLTPSLRFVHPLIEAQIAVQLLWANSDTLSTEDDIMSGTNIRAGVRAKLLDGMIVPFVNFSMLTHNLLNYEASDPNQLDQTWNGQDWHTMTLTAGLDFNYQGKNGVGVQTSWIRAEQGDGDLVQGEQVFISLATTYWLTDHIAATARCSVWMSDYDDRAYVGNQWLDKHTEEGLRSYYLTLRYVF